MKPEVVDALAVHKSVEHAPGMLRYAVRHLLCLAFGGVEPEINEWPRVRLHMVEIPMITVSVLIMKSYGCVRTNGQL